MDEEQAQSELIQRPSELIELSSPISLLHQVLRRAFSMFDSNKSGKIEKEKVRTILNTLGHTYDDEMLDALLEAEDTEGSFVYSFNRSTAINQRTF